MPPVAESETAEVHWVPLFNGKDLTGWVVDSGDEKAWRRRTENSSSMARPRRTLSGTRATC